MRKNELTLGENNNSKRIEKFYCHTAQAEQQKQQQSKGISAVGQLWTFGAFINIWVQFGFSQSQQQASY